MDWHRVNSSAISRIAYYNNELYLDWKAEGGNDIYAYRAPESEFTKILAMRGGIGSYCNRVIKQYPARHVGILR